MLVYQTSVLGSIPSLCKLYIIQNTSSLVVKCLPSKQMPWVRFPACVKIQIDINRYKYKINIKLFILYFIMSTRGYFGYIIGRKKRMILVDYDANLLWQILVREIYVLIKHFGSVEYLKKAFEKIKIVKNKPNKKQIEKAKYFADLNIGWRNIDDWSSLLKYCQSSFINLLECEFVLNENDHSKLGYIFLLDFNSNIVDFNHISSDGKITKIAIATIDEIIKFEDMPIKTYTEIILEMKNNFHKYDEEMLKIDNEIIKLEFSRENAKKQNDVNIEEKINKLIDENKWKKKELIMNQRTFYYRLKALNLIEE